MSNAQKLSAWHFFLERTTSIPPNNLIDLFLMFWGLLGMEYSAYMAK